MGVLDSQQEGGRVNTVLVRPYSTEEYYDELNTQWFQAKQANCHDRQRNWTYSHRHLTDTYSAEQLMQIGTRKGDGAAKTGTARIAGAAGKVGGWRGRWRDRDARRESEGTGRGRRVRWARGQWAEIGWRGAAIRLTRRERGKRSPLARGPQCVERSRAATREAPPPSRTCASKRRG